MLTKDAMQRLVILAAWRPDTIGDAFAQIGAIAAAMERASPSQRARYRVSWVEKRNAIHRAQTYTTRREADEAAYDLRCCGDLTGVTVERVTVEGDETPRDPADGEAIRSIHDREAYVALGRSNTTPGGTDFDTLAWALSATVARVADAATEQELAQVLAWVREGEASR